MRIVMFLQRLRKGNFVTCQRALGRPTSAPTLNFMSFERRRVLPLDGGALGAVGQLYFFALLTRRGGGNVRKDEALLFKLTKRRRRRDFSRSKAVAFPKIAI